MVTTENYEEYLMLDADGELDSAGKQALQAFIAANPALKAEYETWQSLKLKPEPSLTYPDKGALRKQEPKGIVLTLKPYVFAAAAAVLAAVLLIPVLWKSDNEHIRITHTFPVKPKTQPMVDDQTPGKAHAVIHESPVPVVREQEDQSRKQEHIARSDAFDRQVSQPSRISESIAALDMASQEQLAVQPRASAPQPVYQDVVVAVEQEEPQPHIAGLPRIQFAQENRQAFDLLKKAVEARVAQASSVAKSVKETAFVIKLGNGAVNINF